MSYKKAVLVDIRESDLDKKYWDQIDELVESKAFITKDGLANNKELTDADCLLLGFQIPVDKAVIDAAPNLKYIGVLATAFGTVDLEHAKSKNIPVCNLAGYSTESVAEFTIAAVLEQIRQLEKGKQSGRDGNFSFEGYKVRELKNSEFGVVGLGSIGGRVAELAAGFGANVSYTSRGKKDVAFTFKELEDLTKDSEIISINAAQTSETEGMISAEVIESMKNDAVLINTCPPELINTDALAAKLKANPDFIYIFDHGDEMSKEEQAKILGLKNCVPYPPIAFLSREARINKQEIFVGNMKAALDGKPQNQVN